MSTQQKTYLNAAYFEEKEFDNGNSIIKVSIKDINELIQFLQDNKNSDNSIRLVISKKKNIEPNKSTHYAYVDTWQPTNKTTVSNNKTKTTTKPTARKQSTVAAEEDDSLI